MIPFKSILALSRAYLFSPRKAALLCREKGAFAPNLWIYAAFVILYTLFFWIKPADFPDRHAPAAASPASLGFWITVMLWQPPLEIAWILFLLGLTAWFRSGSLPLRLAGGVTWIFLPFALMIAHVQKNGITKTSFAAGSLIWMGLFYPALRRTQVSECKPLASFMLGLNAIGIALLVPMGLAVVLDEVPLFTAAQAGGGLWLLGAATLGWRELTGLRLPRAFMAILLSLFFQVALAFTLHLLDFVPKEILKALLYA